MDKLTKIILKLLKPFYWILALLGLGGLLGEEEEEDDSNVAAE